jgi:hypothetical protein
MFKKMFILSLIILSLFSQINAQLKKLQAPNLYSEAEIYKDEKGKWYSTSVTIKFSKRTIDLAEVILPPSCRQTEKQLYLN